jgi:hypothetical protein
MKISAPILRLIESLVAVSGLLLYVHPLAAQDHRIVDRPVDSFETGLPIPRLGAAFWLDDRQLLTTALPEGAPDVVWAGGDTLTRVVLVNFATKHVQVIAEHAAVMRFDPGTLDAVIGPRDRKADAREIHVGPAGDIVEIRRFGPGEPLPSTVADWPKDQLFKPLRRKADGYLLGDKTKLADHTRSGTPVPTTWVRPGRPDLPLSVGFEEIGPRVVYLDFLKKYLLNTSDAQSSSDTNSRMNRLWKHPYTFTPYRLLSLDGTIEEIPYPQFVFDYGIERFDEFTLTRAGILISQVTPTGGAIYLFQSNQLYRLARKGLIKGMPLSLPTSGVTGLSVAPSGCNVAYRHFDVRLIDLQPRPAPRYLAILNVCSAPNQRY